VSTASSVSIIIDSSFSWIVLSPQQAEVVGLSISRMGFRSLSFSRAESAVPLRSMVFSLFDGSGSWCFFCQLQRHIAVS
jgi:hypothetical protein